MENIEYTRVTICVTQVTICVTQVICVTAVMLVVLFLIKVFRKPCNVLEHLVLYPSVVLSQCGDYRILLFGV